MEQLNRDMDPELTHWRVSQKPINAPESLIL